MNVDCRFGHDGRVSGAALLHDLVELLDSLPALGFRQPAPFLQQRAGIHGHCGLEGPVHERRALSA